MLLKDIVKGLDIAGIIGDTDNVEINDIVYDSREAKEGFFICLV